MTQSSWIGQTLNDRYQIQELLGQGGMSAVYKANDPNLRRVVAVKIIHPHLSRDVEFVRRFEEEAAAVAQLRHPNLIQVYDFNHDEETYYIVFEFVPGESVQARLKRMKTAGRPMDFAEVIDITAKSADGLQYAHTKGLIHRDIKPANIMLNVTGDPIIMDFGIAKIMGGTQHTATGAVLGTARYMSPEQIKGERIDPRTDIYSLGVTLYEMLGGRPPFEADSAMTLMMMHMTDPVPNLQNLRADIPPNLVAIVNKSLAKASSDRFATAAAFASALRNMDSAANIPAASATVFESTLPKPVDPDLTVLEPSTGYDTGAALAAAAAVAAAGTSTAGTTAPPAAAAPAAAAPPVVPPPPSRAPAAATAPPPKSGASRTPLYAIGGVVLLILLAVGVWAIFFRGSGDSEVAGGNVPPAVVVPSETPDSKATIDAGVAIRLETRAAVATQTAAAAVTSTTAPEDPVETAVPTDVPPPTVVVGAPGTIGEVEGQVTIIAPGGQDLPVTPGTPISEGTRFITGSDGQVTFSLLDDSIVQLVGDSELTLDALAADPDDVNQQTDLILAKGDLLLRQVDPGNDLAIFGPAGGLIATLQNVTAASSAPKRATAAKRSQQIDADQAAMSIHIDQNVRAVISCFSGVCTKGDGSTVRPGWETVVGLYDGAFISSFPITSSSETYQEWQYACGDCLEKAPDPLAAATQVPTTTAPTQAAATAAPTQAPATTAPQATPTEIYTATPTAVATEAAAYAARISNITLENGAYIVSYETRGFTEQVPGQHVHFYFDTVSEANAGVPGSGPWKLYGGPRPFTQYTEADRGNASYMCIRVANPDHSIIFGSGNCFPLP